MEPKRFSNRRKQEHIELELEDGTVRCFTVYELMGPGREEFISFNASKIKMDPKTGKPTGVRDQKGISTKLIALALMDKVTGKFLTEEEVKTLSLTGRVEADLVEMISEMSGLTAKAEEEAKND
jgi:hypothetical protein